MTAHANGGLPFSVRPDGVHADLFVNKNVVIDRALFDRHCARNQMISRALTDQHIATLAQWVAIQPDAKPDTAASRGIELPTFLRQVSAAAIVDRDVAKVDILAKAAFVMGAWIVDARENGWQALRYARQLGDAIAGDGMELVAQSAERVGPVAAAAFAEHASSIAKLEVLPVVLHQPTGIPMIEPAWTSRSQAEDLARNVYWTDPEFLTYDHHQHPWITPEPAFLPELDPAAPEPAANDRLTNVISAVNQFLRSGDPDDAASARNRDLEGDHVELTDWATQYWRGPEPTATISEPMVVVHRNGRAQMTWRVG